MACLDLTVGWGLASLWTVGKLQLGVIPTPNLYGGACELSCRMAHHACNDPERSVVGLRPMLKALYRSGKFHHNMCGEAAPVAKRYSGIYSHLTAGESIWRQSNWVN